jgi:non-specific protein-tyrosine kinase
MKFKSMVPLFGNKQPEKTAVPPREKHATLSDTKDKRGWVSPAYSRSRAVKLDPKILEKNRCVAMFPASPEAECYKILRTRILRRTQDGGGRSVMITSAIPGEGKTVTAINLALTFAREFEQTVLLVDCDLRRQSVHEVMGYKSDLGLLNHLLDGMPLPDLIVWPGIEKLTVISGGKTIQESSEVIASPRMRELAADMKARYQERYVFFDVPPVLAGADALAFAPLVDWIIMVVQADQTPLPEVNRALMMLPREKVLGLVLNRQTTQIRAYPYPY